MNRSLSSSSSLMPQTPTITSSRHCVVVIGAGAVGKSALTMQFVQGMFIATYDPTIMDSLMKSDTIEGVGNALLTVVDTAGQEAYAEHRSLYLRAADVCVIVFSVTDAGSFSDASRMFDAALATKPSKRLPFVLVGNKTDLSQQRCVTTDQGRRLAVTLATRMQLTPEETAAVQRDPPFLEVSAMQHSDALLVFHTAARQSKRFRDSQFVGPLISAPVNSANSGLVRRDVSAFSTSTTHDEELDRDGDTTLMDGLLFPARGASTSNSFVVEGGVGLRLDQVLGPTGEPAFADTPPASSARGSLADVTATDASKRQKQSKSKKKQKNGKNPMRCSML